MFAVFFVFVPASPAWCREIIFGSVLLACVVVSYMLAPLIPIDCFRSIIYPAQNVAVITVLVINTGAMFTHSEGIRARHVFAWITGTLSVLMIASSIYRMFVNAELSTVVISTSSLPTTALRKRNRSWNSIRT